MFLTPLLAFGFGSLPLLGWLAAAAAPILIHLWNKRKYQEVSWAAIDFLLAALRRNARRIQLRQWLLLAVRTLILALIVLAAAEPFLQRAGLSLLPGARTHKLIVLDGSYSMAYRPTDVTLFERARQLVRQIVEESPQGDGFTLLLLSDPPRVVVGTPAFERRDFIEELDALKLPHGGGDLPGTLSLAREVIERAARDHPGLQHHQVFFLTDLGRSTWAPDVGPEAAAAWRERVAEVAAQATLQVIDLGQAGGENVAVTRLEAKEPLAIVGREVLVEADVRNFGSQPRPRQLAELFVDDSRIKQEYVDLEGGGEASLSFVHRFETPGPHVVEFRLAGDLLDVDNHRWLSLPVKPQVKVLCISGGPDAADYLASALNPDDSDRAPVQTQIAPESALAEIDLAQFDVVFLSNVAQFTPTEARLLTNYVQQGGGLIVFLGDRVVADNYNRLLVDVERPESRLLPARIGPIVHENQYQLDPLEYRHPIVSVFRGREQAGLLSTRVHSYFRLQPQADWPRAQTVLAFSGGDPLIVEEPRGRGRTILVATAASLSSVDSEQRGPWTTFPVWPSFVPVVHEMLSAAVGSQRAQFNAQVGDSLGGTLPREETAAITVVGPDGRPGSAEISTGVGERTWTYDSTDLSGIYREQSAAAAGENKGAPSNAQPAGVPYAVNVNVLESDLRKADPADLPAEFDVQTQWQDLDRRDESQVDQRAPLHRWLLYSALLLLLAECALASRWSR